MRLQAVRAVADAVLYEGYLLYPYRATSRKNQVRWQFGVLGPHDAERLGVGENSHLSTQCLLRVEPPGSGRVRVHVRFLQIQQRRVQRRDPDSSFVDVPELRIGENRWFAWDEAVEVERTHDVGLGELTAGRSWSIEAGGGEDHEELRDARGELAGRLVRQRWPVRASVFARLEAIAALYRLTVSVDNQAGAEGMSAEDALRRSLVGTHLIIEAEPPAAFVSVIDPPADAAEAAGLCQQLRCWPVLAGEPGDTSTVLGSPIILYDYPEIAAESAGDLFDGTEIDEILTLRVMTMTEQEKAEARATDPKAAMIIDRCDAMTPAELQRLHGILRDPRSGSPDPPDPPEPFDPTDPSDPFDIFDDDHDPDTSHVLVRGARVGKDSVVRIDPQRRADAQDLFYADQLARVTAVHRDLDGETHLAVVLLDDPAADLHDWYGRYLYFSPDEVIPVESSNQEGSNQKGSNQKGG
ncbi:MAG TPA: hypothetical protein VIT42_10940 [Microlunatus sp.]